MPSAKFRKAIYGLSAVLIPLLIVLGVEQAAAAAGVAAFVAVANLIMAWYNVPGDEE